VGSAGALQPGMPIGSLVVAEGAVREDGASGMYVPAGYPAVADPELAVALAQAARELGVPVRSGLVRSHDSFYTDREEELTRSWAARGVLASDMETAALFTVARLRGVRAGSILNVVVTAEGELEEGINRLVANEAAAAAGQRASIQAALRGACRLWLEEKQRLSSGGARRMAAEPQGNPWALRFTTLTIVLIPVAVGINYVGKLIAAGLKLPL